MKVVGESTPSPPVSLCYPDARVPSKNYFPKTKISRKYFANGILGDKIENR